ncbi:hypothetical protein [Streptomyces alboflavus]|uniref:hypothetical protein n=1 Tax=Streptomyces alboflavus TaxID=67267 RepID=UPI00195FAA4A|nr:hypothetical protein [Streptomyces alboflavus]
MVKLLKTPTSNLVVNGGSQDPDKRKSGGHGPTLADEVEKGMTADPPVRLLPTPKATDGSKGGPNQRGSGGDLTLPSTAVRLMPTPTAGDAKDTANFRADGTPYSDGYGETLTDAARLLPTPTATPYGSNQSESEGAAVRPSLQSVAPTLLPTPVAADADRSTSTYTRGNPTLRGATTGRPSGGGKRRRGGTPPDQLMIEVA